jgi:thiol-disulfide isomerase/thioredoxin
LALWLLGASLPVLAAPPLGHGLNPLPTPVAAPAFQLDDMDGDSHDLQEYAGKVILLNFWATWCPPCRREMPSMERLYQQLQAEGFVVVAINQFEDPDHVFAFTGQLSLDPTFPILFDSDSRVAESYNVKGLPSTYLIDRQGRVRYRAIGGREFDHPDVVALIRGLLDEAVPDPEVKSDSPAVVPTVEQEPGA